MLICKSFFSVAGRESAVNLPLYHFNIEFTNNAGKDAEVFIPGSKKRNVIPSGKSLSLKFSKFKMEPTEVVALSKPFREVLSLNSVPMLQIRPSHDADKIVPVTISNPRKYFAFCGISSSSK